MLLMIKYCQNVEYHKNKQLNLRYFCKILNNNLQKPSFFFIATRINSAE